MTALKVLGDWLEDTGWVEALVQAKVASAGTADSFLKAFHITRTRHAHQVTASSMYILLNRSYAHYQESLEPECRNVPQFYFWHTALQLELLVFTFVRSLCVAHFALYVGCLTKLTTLFFRLDHTNYARWVPVHIRDMLSQSTINPEAVMEFMNE